MKRRMVAALYKDENFIKRAIKKQQFGKTADETQLIGFSKK